MSGWNGRRSARRGADDREPELHRGLDAVVTSPRIHHSFFLTGLVWAGVLAGSSVEAQSVGVGVRTGIAVSDFREDGRGWESRLGAVVGGFLELRVAGPFSAALEVVWSEKGGTFIPESPRSRSDPEPPPSTHFDLAYVDFGLLGRYEIPGLTPLGIRTRVLAGPRVSLRSRCRTRGPAAVAFGDAGDPEELVDCSSIDTGLLDIAVLGDHVEQTDVGAVLGVELRRSAGPWNLLVDLRYDHGFRSLDPLFEIKNRTFSVTLGVAGRLP